MSDFSLKASDIKLYLNNKLYNVTQSVNWTIDYQEEPIFGIDSYYPQEITTNKITVTGSVTGFVLRMDGGLQGLGIRPLLYQALQSPYISIRVEDRANKVDLLFVDRAKVIKESVTATAKGLVMINFSFVGIIPLSTLDMD